MFKWKVEARRFGKRLKGEIAGHVAQDGYRIIMINKKQHTAGRLVWLYVHGEMPTLKVDHINHRRADNRLINLRLVTSQDNNRNMSFVTNTTGYMGVQYESNRNKKYRPRIRVDGKLLHLGRYKTLEEAVVVRKRAELKHGFHPNHGTKQ